MQPMRPKWLKQVQNKTNMYKLWKFYPSQSGVQLQTDNFLRFENVAD